jgi:penicillin-binding protein 1A
LGCVDVSLKEVVGMFNVFANNGSYVEPHCIKWVKNKWGTKIYKSNPRVQQLISPRISGQVAKVLQLGLKRIRSFHPQRWVTAEAISKTGTTNDSRVCWFVGSTPTLTTGVYIGRDDNKSMGKNVYPLRTAFPVWMGLNRELTFTQNKFTFDPSLTLIRINSKTGKPILNKKDSNTISILI